MKSLLVILIDAFRYDYLSEKATPFLWEWGRKSLCAPLRTILGYSDSIDATIFTGVYPQDHGHWIMHKYSPETSPFKAFKTLSFIDRIPSSFVIRGMKFVLSATVCKVLARKGGYEKLSTHNIPFRVIGNFDWTTKKSLLSPSPFRGLPTIFDLLRERGVMYSYINAANLSLCTRYSSAVKVRGKLLKAIKNLNKETQLCFIYLHYLDHFAHRHRINSSRFQIELNHVDSLVEAAIRQAKAHFGNGLSIIVTSDHGMADSCVFTDLKELIGDRGFGRDFLLFLDSTMIHVWYLNHAKKQEVRNRIEKLNCGNFISEEEKKKLKINFQNRYYGDDVYLLQVGYSIFPNFMSWLKPYSMHAYHPDDRTQRGIMIAQGLGLEFRKMDFVEVVDLAPSILNILGVPVPAHFKGQSILRRGNV